MQTEVIGLYRMSYKFITWGFFCYIRSCAYICLDTCAVPEQAVKESWNHLVWKSDKVPPEPPFLQAKQPLFPQLLLIRGACAPSSAPLPFSELTPAPQHPS